VLEKEIGNRIRLVRRQKGLRLADLASSSGFSAGLLSKIESGKVSSPISTLAVIAKALGTSFEMLLTNEDKSDSANDSPNEISIVKGNERVRYDVSHNGALSIYEWLAPDMDNRLMEPFIIRLPKEHVPTIYSHHPGQEMIFVLQGKVLLNFRRQNILLEEGDCAFFDATVAHRVRNADDVELQLLCVRSIF
jgi:transcriptional regulator with XRE-family HTH domain